MKVLKPTIGLEIHVELKTNSKMFCGCPANHFNQSPNTQTCPVCLGLPGALPVPNQQAIIWTQMLGLALSCHLNPHTKFDRKHYFYPDLPKGYQISQYDLPFCSHGKLKLDTQLVSITRVHLEEDTAKLQHLTLKGEPVTLIDFNRSGVPLVEIVSEPVLTSAAEAKVYAQKVRQLITYLGISDADMEKGSLRVEANISYGLHLGYKVEVKNINSFRFLEKAINFELKRQKELLDHGQTPAQETRGFQETSGKTYVQRTKETATDYRYFPEPDIPPMSFSPAYFKQIQTQLPRLPQDLESTFLHQYHLRPDYAAYLTQSPALANLAEASMVLGLKQGLQPADIANWLVNKKAPTSPLTPNELISKIKLTQNTPTLSEVDLSVIISQVIAVNPALVSKYRSGKTNVLGVLIGQVVKLSPHRADPKQIRDLLISTLEA